MYEEENNKKIYILVFIFIAIIIFVSFQLFIKKDETDNEDLNNPGVTDNTNSTENTDSDNNGPTDSGNSEIPDSNVKPDNNNIDNNVKPDNKIVNNSNFLKVYGTKLVDKNSNIITLRGFNLGVYLSRSTAFMPIDALANSQDELNSKGYSCINSVAFIQALEKNPSIIERSKKTGRSVNLIAKDLSYILYNNYITEEDFNMIAKTGANVVRLPFEYELFLYQNPNGTYSYSSVRAEAAFKRIDWVIEQCKKRGIYVILDLHIAPGKQNSSGWCGKKIEFFDNSNYKEAVKNMWVKIAERYKNEGTIAGYDLLNEPETGSKKLITFYDSIYSAIRKVDNNHIIIMEETCVFCGYDGVNNSGSIGALPNPSEINASIGKNNKWENVVYSTHDYFYDKVSSSGLNTNNMDIRTSPEKIKSRIKQKTDKTIAKSNLYNIPYYIGEFSHLGSYNTDSSNYKNYLPVWDYAMDYYDSNGISYTPWTYKAGWDRFYGLIYYGNTKGNVNLETSTYEELRSAFERTSSNSMRFNKEYYDMFVSQWK